MKRVSTRIQEVQSPVIPVVRELIERYPGTISLGQGVVHYGPPPAVAEGIAEFLAHGPNHLYGAVGGIALLVAALEKKLEQENHVAVRPDGRVFVTAGGNMAFLNAILALCDPGDEVILLSPYYFNHEMAVTIASCTPVVVATDENYQPRVEAMAAAITPRTRAVVTISPNNPTGAVYPEATLRRINALCASRGIYHVHDEAYEYFVYGDATHFSPGAIAGAGGHTISLHSLSKGYGFASWRIGYMAIPEYLVTALAKIQDTNLICPPVISQYAALKALEAGAAYPRAHVQALAEVRQMVLRHLRQVDDLVTAPAAEGAIYFLLRVRTAMPGMQLVEALVRDFRVAVLPGGTFGANDGCYLRISYGALEAASVAEGMSRLVRGLRQIVGGARGGST